MSPEQFKAIRAKLAMSTYEIADLLGVTDRAVRRYEDGEREISGPIRHLLDLMQHVDGAKERLAKITKKSSGK